MTTTVVSVLDSWTASDPHDDRVDRVPVIAQLSTAQWEYMAQEVQDEEERNITWLIWLLGVGGVLIVILGVLAALHRKGIIFRGSYRRRPSHAQPWRHWNSPRSRAVSMFDLFHPAKRKQSGVMNLEQGAQPTATDLGAAEFGAIGHHQHPFTITGGYYGTLPVQVLAPPEKDPQGLTQSHAQSQNATQHSAGA